MHAHFCKHMWEAAFWKSLERVQELYHYGRHIDGWGASKPDTLQTPFHMACMNDDIPMMEWLSSQRDTRGKRKINPNAVSKGGHTPFWIAAATGNDDAVDWLLERRQELKINVAALPNNEKRCWQIARRMGFPDVADRVEAAAKEDGVWVEPIAEDEIGTEEGETDKGAAADAKMADAAAPAPAAAPVDAAKE